MKIENKFNLDRKIELKVQVVVYCKENQSFLLLKTNKARDEFWQNITGGVEKEEDFIDAAKREAKEETKLSLVSGTDLIKNLNLDFEFLSRRNIKAQEKVFLIIKNNLWDIEIDPNEHQEYKWLTEDKITKNSVLYESNYKAIMAAIGFIKKLKE